MARRTGQEHQSLAASSSHKTAYKETRRYTKSNMFGMNKSLLSATVCAVLVGFLVLSLISGGDATYRKPPFNGSIFGKRGNPADYDNAGKALSAMCEIANEACQSWFPAQENK